MCSGFPSIHSLLWGQGPRLWTHFSLSLLCQGLFSPSEGWHNHKATRAFSVAVWAETGMEATASQVLPDLPDNTWLQGLNVFAAVSRTLQSSTQVQLPDAGIS